MKNNLIIVVLVLLFGFTSCYKDDTTVDTREISNIDIELPFSHNETIQLEKNQEFVIAPIVNQSADGMSLTYEWEIDQQIVSTDDKLVYQASTLGLYEGRLKVSNSDGSTFYRFKLKVNSPYEEGLIVLSEKEDGEGSFSFIRRRPNQLISEMDETAVHKNLFEVNNPNFDFGKNPTDVGQRSNMIYISNGNGKIWGLDHSTFEVETSIEDPNLTGLKPMKMLIPNTTARNAIIISNDKSIYDLATFENFVFNAPALLQGLKVEKKSQLVAGPYMSNYFFWDFENSKLLSYNAYWLDDTGVFLSGNELINFVVNDNITYILVKNKNNPNSITKAILPSTFITNSNASGATKKVLSATSTNLHKDSPGVLVERYLKYVYGDGRSIYQWFFTTDDLPSTPLATITIPGVITAVERDPESRELYVAVYDAAAASSNKGSILVYDIQTGQLKASFIGVSEKPVDLFFKTKVN